MCFWALQTRPCLYRRPDAEDHSTNSASSVPSNNVNAFETGLARLSSATAHALNNWRTKSSDVSDWLVRACRRLCFLPPIAAMSANLSQSCAVSMGTARNNATFSKRLKSATCRPNLATSGQLLQDDRPIPYWIPQIANKGEDAHVTDSISHCFWRHQRFGRACDRRLWQLIACWQAKSVARGRSERLDPVRRAVRHFDVEHDRIDAAQQGDRT